MSCYATARDIKIRGILLEEDVLWLEERYPGIVLEFAEDTSSSFDDYLSKRYGTPFRSPYPRSLVKNVSAVVAYELLVKRGAKVDGTKLDAAQRAHEAAWAWVKEAANSKDGLIELVNAQSTPRGVVAVDRGGPLSYSEASPYSFMDVQRERVGSGEP
jgi:phage gp36-like protein